jgi:arylsulfatase A-like enzyme
MHPNTLLTALAMLIALPLIGSSQVVADKPNVVIIFVDDMGWGDVGFNGATGPQTPNIDQMAAEGMRMNDFYVGCSVCSGSRATLLTGTHWERLGIKRVLFPDSDQGLHPEEVTIADMLKDVGYRTACIGKWHLGHLPPCLPTYHGFDSYYGVPYSNDMWIDPANKLSDDIVIRDGLTREQLLAGHKSKNQVPLLRGEEVIEYPADQTTLTKRYTDEAVKFLKSNTDEPFFLYLPHTMVHVPLATSKAFRRHESKIWNAIEEVDWSVGKILKTLKDEGLSENTLVVFTSDNGAAVGSSKPFRGRKFSVYDGGIREPTVMWWPNTIPAGSVCDEVCSTLDMLPTLAVICNGKLPDHQVDGHNIFDLLIAKPSAKSPHKSLCLTDRRGTVRHGRWKFFPWPEKAKGNGKASIKGANPDSDPVQLYDVRANVTEQKNVAAEHPEIVAKLQKIYDAHVADLETNQRPSQYMKRPEGSPSPKRPPKKVKRKNAS